MLFTTSVAVDLILIFITTSVIIYKYSTRNFNHWKKKGIFYFEPIPIFGNILDVSLFRTTIGEWLKKFYDNTNEPFFGIFVFGEPHLVVKSPELIKNILVKDFSYFQDRTVASPIHNEILSNMIFLQKNPHWKETRSKITPVFTSGKLKLMCPHMNLVGDEMNQYIGKREGEEVEAKEICAKYSTDLITKCGFGVNANSFQDEDAPFRKIGRTVFDFRWRTALIQTAYFFGKSWVKLFRLDFIEKDTIDYLKEVCLSSFNRRKEIDEKGNDLIDIFVKIRKNDDLYDEIKFNKLVAQSIQFFAAGFETTSSTMAFTLYEMCLNPEIQEKLRSEIVECIQEHGEINYEAVNSLKYLDLCVKETLRKYPVLPFLDRRCQKDYVIPGTDKVIEKGTSVYIPMFGLHLDEKFFPEPEKYDPERFADKNAINNNGLYYIPFGEGPRICIGERFGMLGTKIGIARILSEFIVEKTQNTPSTIELEPKSLLVQSKVGLPMKFTSIKK